MAYIPDIVGYRPFYIQTESDSVAIDTTEWGLVAKVNPYPLLPNPKEPYKNEWNDENGDHEWCDVMHYEPIEFSISFYIKTFDDEGTTAEHALRNVVNTFFQKIRKGEFRTFDSYNGIGWDKVRYAGYTEESFTRRGNWARAIFEIRFKVNDPVERYVLRDGRIEHL